MALRLALEAPERVASLTLIEPVLYSLLAETANRSAPSGRRGGGRARRPRPATGARAAATFLARWGAAGGLGAMTAGAGRLRVDRMPIVLAAR